MRSEGLVSSWVGDDQRIPAVVFCFLLPVVEIGALASCLFFFMTSCVGFVVLLGLPRQGSGTITCHDATSNANSLLIEPIRYHVQMIGDREGKIIEGISGADFDISVVGTTCTLEIKLTPNLKAADPKHMICISKA